MPIFELSAAVTVSAYTKVEAETLEEAISIAGDRESAIGGVHSGISDEDFWVIDDADGSAQDIREA